MQQNEEKCPRCPNGWLAEIKISGVPVMACDECQYTEDVDYDNGWLAEIKIPGVPVMACDECQYYMFFNNHTVDRQTNKKSGFNSLNGK